MEYYESKDEIYIKLGQFVYKIGKNYNFCKIRIYEILNETANSVSFEINGKRKQIWKIEIGITRNEKIRKLDELYGANTNPQLLINYMVIHHNN
jgi:hypothetical protein